MTEQENQSQSLYTAAEVRELDRVAIEDYGIPGITLMRRAGRACFDRLLESWPGIRELTLFCGGGNNAGDGYVIAGLAAQRGLKVQVIWLRSPDKLQGDALRAYRWAMQFELSLQRFSDGTLAEGEVVVDALLGTGLTGPVRDDFRSAIECINASGKGVLAVDVPSGLDADTGGVLGACVRADVTVTFIGCKQGLMTHFGPEMTGQLLFEDLAVPAEVYTHVQPSACRLQLATQLGHLPRRNRNAHKGQHGHLLVMGGDHGMAGAVSMASEAAARVGAGLVTVVTRPEHVAPLIARRPEVMVHGVDSRQQLEPLMDRFTCIVVGPGLGRSAWSAQMLQLILATDLPLVVDADALNLIAAREPMNRQDWIMTPHPGEAARLLGCQTMEIQHDRYQAVVDLQGKYGGMVLLKGAGTLLRDPAETSLCPYGNPGMAVAGMGDVLSGVIGGLLAQGLSLSQAAKLGVCLHSRAADLIAAERGERGILATDLMPELRRLVNSQEITPGHTEESGQRPHLHSWSTHQ
jgi:NAD(P)H-hydrate epimerase|tara:strand:- start:3350 stop:4912 length:1563 start_codon:yes stop_codon:yes gene_type:complete